MNTRDVKFSFRIENANEYPVSLPGYVEVISKVEPTDGRDFVDYKVLCEELMAEEFEAWVRRTPQVKFL